ncbi:hypothetical protein TNCV_1331721 [Trichonephila clavipes]|nr:hypothetical protein TNCV_1331721 [Trichonephila clavipes]
MGDVFKTTSVCTNSSTTLAWTFNSETLTSTTLKLHHRQTRLQRCDQRRTWAHEWQGVVFSDESRFCLQHQDIVSVLGGIVVNAHWQHAFVIVILDHHMA